MRIRRAMKKMLGSATVYPLFLGEKWDDGSAGNGSVEVCQLNQSPWDAASTDLDLFTAACSQSFESAVNSREEAQPVDKEEEEEADKAIIEKSEGILVNSTLKSENKTEPIGPCKRAKESTEKSEHSEMIDMVVAGEGDILCKKNDGKKWFCKRPAQLPHRFCEYHIRAKPNPKPKPEPKPKPKRKKPKREKNKDITSSSSFFYYYEGFGPWRGKRRGETEEATHDHMKEEEEQESNKKDQEDRYIEAAHDDPNKKDEKIMDGRDLRIAGLLDEDDYDYEEIVASSSKGNGEKKVGKKRGRKPLKCRSLKSLM